MRHVGERFHCSRVVLKKEEAIELFMRVKQKLHLTWKEIAELFDVSEFTAYHGWGTGRTTLPYPVYSWLMESLHMMPSHQIVEGHWGQQKGGSLTRRPSKTINLNNEIAELYGAMLGDGCIYSNGQTIALCGNSISDYSYITVYLRLLFETLFEVHTSLYFRPGTVQLTVNRKNVVEYFASLGFPMGVKNSSPLQIPASMRLDKEMLSRCLRGIFDTDGGVYRHPHSRIMISLSSKSTTLLDCVQTSSLQLGLEFGRTSTSIQLYGATGVEKFMNVIGSSNLRLQHKYDVLTERGVVPTAKETEAYLKTNQQSSCDWARSLVASF